MHGAGGRQQDTAVADPFITQPLGVTPGSAGLNVATATPTSIVNPVEIDMPSLRKIGLQLLWLIRRRR
jgi:hypothetical protein